ncbi:hypothetical protein [Shewanella aestuarii]|uniref:DUF3718 domain-containing protein n=1 Tax=Shewanella aestuarii TaxID=1028752 RepID=A0A6G9QM71_9GAMM|nr:hypothetical protein [Shewanella aestuarii]QIR15646.1 hypothetical protein HBH39_15085 [Shewanella aestuarii]
MNKIIAFSLFAASMLSFSTSADILSDSASLGVNAGTMKYCSTHFATKENKDNYNFLSVLLFRELNNLESGKIKAIAISKGIEDTGTYLGKPLTAKRCESLRKVLALRYLN